MAPASNAYDAKSEIDALKATIEELKLALADTDKRASAHFKKTVWIQSQLLPDTLPKKRVSKAAE